MTLRIQICIILLIGSPHAVVWSDEPATSDEAETVAQCKWACDSTDEQRREARKLFEEGGTHFQHERYAQALERYQAALRLWRHPSIYYNSARAAVFLQRPLEAWHFLDEALKHGPEPLEEGRFEEGKLLQLSLRGQLCELTIHASGSNVELIVDGSPVRPNERGHYRAMVVAGDHRIAATRRGFLPYAETVHLPPRGNRTIEVALEPVPIPPVVTFERRWPSWVPWMLVGLGTASVATGIGFGVVSEENFDRFDKQLSIACPDGCLPEDAPAEALDIRTRGRNQRTASIVTASAGVAVVAGGVAMVVLNQPKRVERPATVVPIVSRGQLGMALDLRF